MECKDVENLLSRFLENELTKQKHREISDHLKECRSCHVLKEKMEQLINSLPGLEEEIPFFLKNRLYYIPEAREREKDEDVSPVKWIAAAVGTIVLFLNLFYFTNIYPPANKILHTFVSNVKKITVETETLIEKIRESKEVLSFIRDKTPPKQETRKAKTNGDKKEKGGKNG